MRKLRTILFLLVFVPAISASAQTTCTGDYSWLVNGMTVTFFGNTSPNITSVIWNFGDGNFNYSNSLYTNHTYFAPGTYTACIQFYDSINGCADSTCHIFMLDSCFGSFTYTMNGVNGNFYGSSTGTGPNVVYQWNFGDNGTSSQQNPVHTYAQPGNYTVCFSFYDLSTGCADSICMPVSTGGCYADFTSIDSMGYVFFINQSSLGSAGMYIWDYGDGSPTDNAYNPSHVFPAQGVYQVCLTAYDSAQNFCDSTCHMVTVTQVASVSELNKGEIHIAPNPANDHVNISLDILENSTVQVSVLDISGREVVQEKESMLAAGQHQIIVSTEGLPSGTYFLRLSTNRQTVNSKLVIVKSL